jgi:hypothetical protein
VRSLQEGWAQVEPPSPGAPPAIIDRGTLPAASQRRTAGRCLLPPGHGRDHSGPYGARPPNACPRERLDRPATDHSVEGRLGGVGARNVPQNTRASHRSRVPIRRDRAHRTFRQSHFLRTRCRARVDQRSPAKHRTTRQNGDRSGSRESRSALTGGRARLTTSVPTSRWNSTPEPSIGAPLSPGSVKASVFQIGQSVSVPDIVPTIVAPGRENPAAWAEDPND